MVKKKLKSRRSHREPSVVISARIKNEDFEIIDTAARIREVDLQEIVFSGAKKEAMRILKHSVRAIRAHKERQRRARLAARRAKSKGGA